MVRFISENEDLTIQEARPQAYLTLITDNRLGHTFPLRGEVELGREKSNAIVVSDPKASRHHALLSPGQQGFIIQDQVSANGTYVNGVLIGQPTPLNHKDKVMIGDTLFLFTVKEPTLDDLGSLRTASASAAPDPPSAAAPSSSSMIKDQPVWVVIGCMAVALVILLFLVALMLGLFIGSNQAGLLLL